MSEEEGTIIAGDEGEGETLVTPAANTEFEGDEGKVTETNDGKPGEKADGQSDATLVGAPKEYETFDMPEGMEMNEAELIAFTPVARDAELSQEQAQKVITYEAARVAEHTQSQIDAWAKVNEDWKTEVRSDKELGGPAYDVTVGNAKTALKAYGTPALMDALVSTGMGNHPEFIRMFSRVGKAMGEDNLSTGGPAEGVRSAADILYPNQGN